MSLSLSSLSLRVAVVADERALLTHALELLRRDLSFDPFPVAALDAWRLLRSAEADVVILDYAIADLLELCGACTGGRCVGAVVMDVPDGYGADVSALLAGARGLVYAHEALGPIARAVRMVAGGGMWGPRRAFADAWARIREETGPRRSGEAALASRLSAREREVLRFAAVGLANKEVAERLAISQATVKVHLSHIFQKLGLRGRGELAAAFHGIIR
jgi:DNA-binding NarL/FixJ family response regulator